MQVSLKWLQDYVDVDLSPEALADRLTMAGLEVDALTRIEPAFRGVRVGRIVSIKPHPGAEKLSLCEVTTGEETLPVVCGAKNIREGDVVPVAVVGATLPGGVSIRSARIRDALSEGMLCSEQELGLGNDASGIMLLSPDLPLGEDLAVALDVADAILDIGVTPNRSDCLSIIGIAREVAAITGRALRLPASDLAESDVEACGITSVVIEAPDLCPRYTARVIRDVRIGPSPFWMKRRLEAVGLRSINNVVDVTNYVMIELGQPLHAFDFRFLEEGRIVVRRPRAGETFVSLDGKERTLTADTLMICDGVRPVAIGGVMGGLNSEVKEETGTVLLESAYFNPVSIRRTARSLGMGTDAAYRFERGIDPEGVVRALDRAAALIAKLSGGTVCRGVIDSHPAPVATASRIPLRPGRVREILGTEISQDEITRLLTALQMQLEPGERGELLVTPPACRVDILREIDLIEEVVRLHGFDRVPATLPAVSVNPAGLAIDARRKTANRFREIMTAAGYAEVINYSFIPQAAVDQLGLAADDTRRRHVQVRNPLTEEQAVMRTTMVYSLLRNALRNSDAGRFDLRIFETGRTYIATAAGTLPEEKNRAAVLLTGRRYEDRWHFSDLKADFYDLKGCIENLLGLLRIPAVTFRAGVSEPFLHPGKSCGVFSGEELLGVLGEVHPDVLARISLTGAVFVCELDLDRLSVNQSEMRSSQPLPRFPSSSRDVAFLVRRELEAAALLGTATGSAEELLEKVEIFDVYEGKHVPQGTKSLGLRFSYRSPVRTLTDDEINEVHGRIVQQIVQASGAAIR